MKCNEKERRCVLCKKEYTGYGNNAEPLAKGRCCDACNNKVIMARINGIRGRYRCIRREWKGTTLYRLCS